MELSELTERIADIRQRGPRAVVRERVAVDAEQFDRASQSQARIELVNESLCRLTELLYRTDADGQWANIDRRTWRILIPAPWGSGGWKRWELRSWEAECLRSVLRVRAETKRGMPPLFDYNETARTWHVNLRNYADLRAGLDYLKNKPITLGEWRKAHEPLLTQARNRMTRLRER